MDYSDYSVKLIQFYILIIHFYFNYSQMQEFASVENFCVHITRKWNVNFVYNPHASLLTNTNEFREFSLANTELVAGLLLVRQPHHSFLPCPGANKRHLRGLSPVISPRFARYWLIYENFQNKPMLLCSVQ